MSPRRHGDAGKYVNRSRVIEFIGLLFLIPRINYLISAGNLSHPREKQDAENYNEMVPSPDISQR